MMNITGSSLATWWHRRLPFQKKLPVNGPVNQ
jgi:hypothetical protein